MYKYLLKISYDGSRYSGWQKQPNAPSIQEALETVLSQVLQQSISIYGSGRTDGGVHAKGQAAHFTVDHNIDIPKLLLALNGLLPWDVRVKEIIRVPLDFHARFSAKGKIYHYHFWQDAVIDPMVFPYRLHMRKPFNPEKMKEALPLFVGQKDFTTFANLRESGQKLENPVRHLKRLELIYQEGGCRLEFEGDGFLYKMVRNIVGTLIEVGQSRRDPQTIHDLFSKKDRTVIGAPAPAKGLFLEKVLYENNAHVC